MKSSTTRLLKLSALFCTLLILGLFVMPNSWKEALPLSTLKEKLVSKKVNFGLDLVGGRQIDYRVDLSQVEQINNDNDPDNDRDPDAVVDNVASILRRRIDPQGTRELNIYKSDFDNEKHVIVEITADLDNAETLQKLQQIIDLEFKEQDSTPDEEALANLKSEAGVFLEKVNSENFEEQANALNGQDNVRVSLDRTFWKDQLDNNLDEETVREVWNAPEGTVIPKVVERTGKTIVPGASGNFEIQDIQEFVIMEIGKKSVATREKTDPGEDFETVRVEVSEKPDLQTQKLLEVDPAFQDALLNVDPGLISEVLESETDFAFFQILPATADEVETQVSGVYISKGSDNVRERIDAARARTQPVTTTSEEEQLFVSEVSFALNSTNWKSTGLGGLQFKRARVGQDPNTGKPLVEILFNEEGARLFEELTARNVGKPMAIFVGGEFISAPTIQEKISGGSAVITLGIANYAEARKEAIRLAQELNGGSTPAPFQEVGQFKIGSILGTTALDKSLKAGVIGLGLLAIWMILVYRFLGFLAVLALGFYALFIVFLLEAHLSFGIATFLGVLVFTVGIKSFSSLERNELLSLLIALLLGTMATLIANSSIVLTLAGVAGIVLSIGMAVDANILIFERIKEELHSGKNFSAATSLGFERAWSSIRDSNLSSLITCTILWVFGSAVIKGFAAALAMGIIISMLTAITVTRALVTTLIGHKMARKEGLLLPRKRKFESEKYKI